MTHILFKYGARLGFGVGVSNEERRAKPCETPEVGSRDRQVTDISGRVEVQVVEEDAHAVLIVTRIAGPVFVRVIVVFIVVSGLGADAQDRLPLAVRSAGGTRLCVGATAQKPDQHSGQVQKDVHNIHQNERAEGEGRTCTSGSRGW